MKAEEITPINATAGFYHSNSPADSRRDEAQSSRIKETGHSDKVKTPKLDHIQFNKLEASNTDAHDIAQSIREVNRDMERIDGHLQKMKAALESIVKIYPPYPPGSAERVEALRQFSAFRQMIDQIAQPGSINGLKNILGDPGRNSGAGDWQPTAGLRFRHQPVHTGPGGLDIPEMNMESTNAQITDALQKTTSAEQTLGSRHRSFIADANKVISRIA